MELKFHTTPWKHQLEALEFLMPRDCGALFTTMGSGKTKVMIDMIINKDIKRTLVVATSKICSELTWESEITIHSPSGQILVLSMMKIEGKLRSTKVEKLLNSNKGFMNEIMVVNYESVWREPFKSFLLNKYKPQCVICDESHKIKSPGSKVSRMLNLLGRRAKYRYAMTGTPIDENPLDIYAQYRFVDSSIYGTNYDVFKNTYANWISYGAFPVQDKRNPWKDLEGLIAKMYSIGFYTEEIEREVKIKTKDIIVEFQMSEEAQENYRHVKKHGSIILGDKFLKTDNILTLITRLKQICSGYIHLKNDDNSEKLYKLDDSREEAFKKLLLKIPEHEPIVVFAMYKKDLKNIHKVCKSLGIKSSELSGSKSTYREWVDGKSRVIAIQISAGCEGLNELVRARYCIYYSLTNRLIQWNQSRGRLDRPRQTRNVRYYILVAKLHKGKSIDDLNMEALANKQNLTDYIKEQRTI